jgi:hypothetical protein
MKLLNPSVRTAEYRDLCALSVMTKAPRPGNVKTRLAPPLTLEESAALNICFLRDTFTNISEVRHAAGVAVYTPQGEEAAFNNIVPPNFLMLPQRGEDFGQRLFAAAQDLLSAGFGSCCLIDSDSPTVPHRALQLAVQTLAEPGDRVVLGPTDDGGYYLIGLKHAHPHVFKDILWSSPTVFDATMDRIAEQGLDVTLLPRWFDVDDGPTLKRLVKEMFDNNEPTEAYAAPHTREFAAKLIQQKGWNPR